jgi:hypothetical protein
MNENEPLSTLTDMERLRVVNFTQLLCKVSPRVSRQKPTSQDALVQIGKGLIDKLEIFLPTTLFLNNTISKCNELGLRYKDKYLGKLFTLEIQIGTQRVNCVLGKQTSTEFNKVITNPSHGRFCSSTELNLMLLFGPTVLQSKIYRIDFTADIYEEYQQVLRGLDVKYKSANIEYIGKSVRTGVKIGANNDKVIIYNKALKEKVDKPWTRIERQMSGSKVPIKKLIELRYALPDILDFDPLGIVTLNNLELIKPDFPKGEQLERFYEFRTLIEHEGYFLTRKKLNEKYHKNFNRYFGEFFNLTPYQYQPSDIFKSDIINFFQEVIQ